MPLAEALYQKGVTMFDLYHARGSNIGDPPERNRLPRQIEKEVLVCIALESEADEIFEYIFQSGQIGEPQGGLMYMESVGQTSPFQLPKTA